jgi:hypothetical protein
VAHRVGESLLVWCSFVFFQTVRNRDCFLPASNTGDEDAPPPSNRES